MNRSYYPSLSIRLSLIACLCALPIHNAFAQADDGVVLEKIVVTAGVRGSLSRALDQKREAVGVLDAIVAEDIADFPDLNIGEALQRVTGVTLDRSDNGEGRRLSVRGLPADFVRSTLKRHHRGIFGNRRR